MNMDDAKLIEQIKSRNQDAMVSLHARYSDLIYSISYRVLNDTGTAEECVQDTFMRVWQNTAQFDSTRGSLVAWLIGIARHKLVDHWRRVERTTRNLRAVGDTPVEDDPWDAHLDALLARDVLDRLGAHHRSALTLRYVDDLPVPEVAAIIDRTVHATEALLVRARRAFRDVYEQLDPEVAP